MDDSIVAALEAQKQELLNQNDALQAQSAQLERIQRTISQEEVRAAPFPPLMPSFLLLT